MYLNFYGLGKKPFQTSSDPSFLWLGEKHKEALATLRYGVMDNKGFLVITGDVGTGKTTLINALVESFAPNEMVCAIVTDPELKRLDFFNIIANAFGIPKTFHSKADFLIYFTRFLQFQAKKGRKTVLVIDESQRLSQALLEEIRLLSNIERSGQKLLNIFFLGQNEFLHQLAKTENRALKQRITLQYHLEPLTRHETNTYIRHRLRIAGADQPLFTSASLERIYEFSKGYPRLINIICDHALLSGYVYESSTIDETIVEECVKELEIEPVGDPVTSESGAPSSRPKPSPAQPSRPPARFRATSIIIIALLIALVAAAGILIYYLHSDPTKSIREKIQQLQSVIQRLEEKSIPVHRVPAQKSATAAEAEKVRPLPENRADAGHTETNAVNSPVPVQNSGSETGLTQEPENSPKHRLDAFLSERGNPFAVYLVHNSNKLTDADYALLDRFAAVVLPVGEVRLVVTGYTNSSDASAHNQTLPEFRANAVKSYLVGKGIPPSRIEAVGDGQRETIAASGRESRMVEIRVVTRAEGKKIRA